MGKTSISSLLVVLLNVTVVYGLIILAIAEVFRTGTRLDEDQSLTI